MTVITITFFVLANWVLYNTSQRATLFRAMPVEQFVRNHRKSSKGIGALLLLVGAVLATMTLGLCSGILFSMMAVMTIVSLTVILPPLKIFNRWLIFGLLGILLMIEIL